MEEGKVIRATSLGYIKLYVSFNSVLTRTQPPVKITDLFRAVVLQL